MLTLVIVASLSQCLYGQAAQRYQAFPCRHKTPAQIQKFLVDILPDNELTDVVVDDKSKQVLVRGTADTLRMAAKLIRNIDQEPTVKPIRETASESTGIRFVDSEPESTTSTSNDISQEGRAPRTASPQRESRVDRRRAQERQSIPTDAVTRFFRLQANVSAVEGRLVSAFKGRISRSNETGDHFYLFHLANGQSIEIEFDSRRRGVLITSPESLIPQLRRLFTALEVATSPNRKSQRTAVVSIERSDTNRLQQAINAYRGPQSAKPPVDDSSSLRVAPRSGLALVNYLFQEDSQVSTVGELPEEDAAPPSTIAPLNEGGGIDVDVEVETLPDLDVIILRGSDRDVNKLTQIIQELERLSRETLPEIQIYKLQNAQSVSVTSIVQSVLVDLTGRRQGRVSLTPLVKPNAILLIGWGDAIATAIDLITKLDSPVSPESQFQVFRLNHAPVTAVNQAIQQFFANRQGLGTKIQSLADNRSNSLVIYAAPRDLQEVRRLIESLDIPKSSAVKRANVFRIKHALAADLAQTLQAAITASGSGQGAPNAILELVTIDSQGEKLIQSGMLTDVRITANARNNTILVSGPNESLPLIAALIEQLDSPSSTAQIKVFRINNGDAASLIQMLRSLLPTDMTGSIGPRLPAADGETSLAPLRFSIDTRTNSIIAVGSEGDLEIIAALLVRLDEKDLAERKNEVYRLKNSPAIDVAVAINEFLRSERIVSQAGPGSDSPFEQIEREVVVVPEPVRNTLIISATPRYFEEIKRLIVQLDEAPAQVLIQVLIGEIQLNNAYEFGVEMGLQDSILFDRSLLGELVTTVNTTQTSTANGIVTSTSEIVQAATNEPGFNFNNRPLGNSGSTRALENSDRVGGQGLSHFAVGRVNNELGFGGLVLSASSESVSVLIRALQETRRLDVLSRPQVRTLDNQEAFIQVGQRVPRITASNITEGGLQTNSVELENVGLILGVTPRISPDGTVVMELNAEKSSLGPEQEGIPITVSVDGSVIRAPRINTTTAQTTVSAANGETIILGGLITKEQTVVNRNVPYLSKIPLLGDVFKYESIGHRRSELLIILTPHVIRKISDSERINQMEMARISWCAADVYDIHGDLGLQHQGPITDGDVEVIYPHENPRGKPKIAPNPADLISPGEELIEPKNTSLLPPANFRDDSVHSVAMEVWEDREEDIRKPKKSRWPFKKK